MSYGAQPPFEVRVNPNNPLHLELVTAGTNPTTVASAIITSSGITYNFNVRDLNAMMGAGKWSDPYQDAADITISLGKTTFPYALVRTPRAILDTINKSELTAPGAGALTSLICSSLDALHTETDPKRNGTLSIGPGTRQTIHETIPHTKDTLADMAEFLMQPRMKHLAKEGIARELRHTFPTTTLQR